MLAGYLKKQHSVQVCQSTCFDIKSALGKSPILTELIPAFYEVYEIMMVEGVEKYHRNMDETFKTEEEAKFWIDKQSSKRC